MNYEMQRIGLWTETEVASTLAERDYKSARNLTVKVINMENDVYSLENHPNDSRMGIDPQGKVQTLSGRMGTGGNKTPMTMVSYGIDSYNQAASLETINPLRSASGGDTKPSDQSYTLNTTEVHGVASMEENNYRVRRLTPLECERLQGYPDGWTDIGEWTDSKGKVRQTTDSARYKALGNSIGLPPWKWVLKRISAQYERDATMASLFDGIGGFTLLWSELNGSGSVLWASEIEDYCIAVTKKHFGDDEAGTNGDWHEYIYGRYQKEDVGISEEEML